MNRELRKKRSWWFTCSALCSHAQGWQPIWLAVFVGVGLCASVDVSFCGWALDSRKVVTKPCVFKKFQRNSSIPTRGKFLPRGHDILTLVDPLKCRQCFCLVDIILLEWTKWTEKNLNHTSLKIIWTTERRLAWHYVTRMWDNVTTSTSNRWPNAVATCMTQQLENSRGSFKIKGQLHHERSCILLRCCLPICLHGE